MSNARADELGQWLLSQHDGRRPFQMLPTPPAAPDEAFIYDVQDALNRRRLARGETVAGYKIGLTTPVMQQLCHGDRPIAGVVFERTLRSAPAPVRAADFVRLGIESELAVRLGAALASGGRAVTRADVAASVTHAAAAFELIEDRFADYATLDWRAMAADNSWHGGLILGAAVPIGDVRGLDDGLAGRLTIDGVANAEGSTSDVLGHPYDAVVWLANHLRARGGNLLAGHWISTGSIVPIRHAAAGQRYRFTLAGLPPVELAVD